MTIPNTISNIREKLQEKTIIDTVSGCWLWTGAKYNTYGHGQINFNYSHVSVHRLSAFLYLGLIDIDDLSLQVNHKVICKHPNCWNPDHLYLGSQLDNVRDTIEKGNRFNPNTIKTHCPKGHPYDENNTLKTKDNKRLCRECRKIINARNNAKNRIHYKMNK